LCPYPQQPVTGDHKTLLGHLENHSRFGLHIMNQNMVIFDLGVKYLNTLPCGIKRNGWKTHNLFKSKC